MKNFINSNCVPTGYLRALVLLSLPGWAAAQTSLSYTITTFAGQGGVSGFAGDGGAATSANFNGPFGVVVDSSGNVYISDQFNERVRKVAGGNISTVAGNGTAGFSGDGASATSAELNSPAGLALDTSGNLLIADGGNYEVRKVSGGNISTFAGENTSGSGYSGDGGAATSAQLSNPSSVAVDSAANVYIADPQNNVIRLVATSGSISTYAGGGPTYGGYLGDGGAPTLAYLNNPESVAVDTAGNLYIADTSNNVIRKISGGIITTVAGNGITGYSGDGGPALKASLNNPKGVAVDTAGNIYIADTYNNVIRVVEPNGTIATIAGNQSLGYGFSGDNGLATIAQLYFPSSVAVSGGKVYIADTGNEVVRVLTAVAVTPKINAGGVVTASYFGASTSVAPGSWIEIYGSSLAADSREWSGSDFTGANAPLSLDGTTVTVGGVAAAIDYINNGQVNAQIPSTVGTGTQTLVVSTQQGASAAYNLTVSAAAPGLFAPPSFNVGGKQYVGAVFSDYRTFALPTGAVSGITSRPAKPGDTIILYGVGFGAVAPAIPSGQLVGQQNSLVAPVQFSIGQTPATANYYGLAPGQVGLYQFNLVVPTVPANNATPLTFTLGGAGGTQTVYIAVGN